MHEAIGVVQYFAPAPPLHNRRSGFFPKSVPEASASNSGAYKKKPTLYQKGPRSGTTCTNPPPPPPG